MDLESVRDLSQKLSHLYHEIDAWLGEDILPRAADQAVHILQRRLGFPADLVYRVVSGPSGASAHLLYIDGTADKALVQDLVQKLAGAKHPADWTPHTLAVGSVTGETTVSGALRGLLTGKLAVLLSSRAGWWLVDTSSVPKRSPSEPSSQTVLHGPHIGFIEDFDTNVALLREFLPTDDLRLETLMVGLDVSVRVGIVSLRNAARAAVLRSVRQRLQRATVESLIDPTVLQSYLGSRRGIPTVQVTERPDQVTAALLEGRVAVMAERSPVVLLVPAVLSNLLARPGDYYQSAVAATFTRLLRYAGVLLALILPALYVGVLGVTQHLLPIRLWLTIIGGRLTIPFTILVETLGMLIAFDILTEAGQQIPGALGQIITVVGGLFVGQAAISSGVVSAPTVIVVAASYTGQFLIPSLELASLLRLLRYPLILLATVFGLFGVAAGLVALFGIAAQVTSYGEPYLWPLTALKPQASLQDSIVRLPVTARRRPFRVRR